MKCIKNKLGLLLTGVLISGISLTGPLAEAQTAGWKKYGDPRGRFAFNYPSDYGKTSRGTNNGFGNRLVALRFANFSAGIHKGKLFLGGEAVLTKGRITLDIQAAGGLYDSISMEMFPDNLRKKLVKNLPALRASNLCRILAKEDHIDLNKKGLRVLSSKIKTGIRQMDRMRNIKPKLIFCKVSKNTVSFHKTAIYQAGTVRAKQHIYGVVRFLRSPYSSFQIIRGSKEPPGKKTVASMTALVDSIVFFK
ncbi:MAG: hypothetical protein ACQ9MH_02515 [Nitrospinales bacterium]